MRGAKKAFFLTMLLAFNYLFTNETNQGEQHKFLMELIQKITAMLGAQEKFLEKIAQNSTAMNFLNPFASILGFDELKTLIKKQSEFSEFIFNSDISEGGKEVNHNLKIVKLQTLVTCIGVILIAATMILLFVVIPLMFVLFSNPLIWGISCGIGAVLTGISAVVAAFTLIILEQYKYSGKENQESRVFDSAQQLMFFKPIAPAKDHDNYFSKCVLTQHVGIPYLLFGNLWDVLTCDIKKLTQKNKMEFQNNEFLEANQGDGLYYDDRDDSEEMYRLGLRSNFPPQSIAP